MIYSKIQNRAPDQVKVYIILFDIQLYDCGSFCDRVKLDYSCYNCHIVTLNHSTTDSLL